jgi:hypothetical protein
MAQGRKIYRTARGKQVDLDLLISRNELTPAVGNAKVNARGDMLGPGGKIIRKREDVLKDYYKSTTGMRNEVVVKETALSKSEVEEFEEFDAEPVVEDPAPKPKATTTTKTKTETKSEEPEWIEDEDGNFIRKGE